ncbi:MAG: hypothetical protein M0Z51_15645, partial [Propionibacterium sp.]|nr:hypothetical protein [Propionibacterium sp.]
VPYQAIQRLKHALTSSGGGGDVDPDVALMWREYRACQVFHCTPVQLGDVPAVAIDWHLAMDDMAHEIEEERSRNG